MSNMTDLWLSRAIFSTSKYSKTRFRRGSAPDPAGGAYTTLSQTPNTNSWLRLCTTDLAKNHGDLLHP